MAYEFRFPDIGEGITEGELLVWKVKEGDEVAQDQTLAEMETDKAVVEMPSPRPGRVLKLHAAEGDIVNVGDVLVTIEEAAALVRPRRRPPACSGRCARARTCACADSGRRAAHGEGREPKRVPYTGSVVGQLEEAPEEEEEVRAAAAGGGAAASRAGDPRPCPRSGRSPGNSAST